MAVIIDIGDGRDIHPRNKEDVGKRLALAARAVAFDEKIVYSGPMYDSMAVEGGKVRLKFKHVGGGLMLGGPQPGDKLRGFAIAAADGKFVWADATIEGDAVVVRNDKVTAPAAVRYDWADNPDGNLYNQEGLPASPFRTDAPAANSPAASARAIN
jgi:sialate O-acetylesterase